MYTKNTHVYMRLFFSRTVLLAVGAFFVGATLATSGQFVFAQTGSTEVDARRAELETELAELEKEIGVQRIILKDKQKEGVSIKRDVAILNAEIQKARLVIRSRNIAILNLEGDIRSKNEIITDLNKKLERQKESLSELLRKTNEIDEFTLVEVILGNQELSEFFADVDSFDAIKERLNLSFYEIRAIREATDTERAILGKKKSDEVDAKVAKEREKRAVEVSEAEKQRLLGINKNQEKAYQKVLNEREARAATIRSTLFALRDSAPIPFGDALDYATVASTGTGVRPAFILAILTQESNLGENIGSCYLRDTEKGDGVGKNTGRFFSQVMKPGRDVAPFLKLMKKLGLDPFNTPVSCPWSGGGYGGAMGPSQFIPSTWDIFSKDISRITGNNPASPYNPKDAITATSLFLADLGANVKSYTAEREAALRYYAGGYWNKSKNAFYADGNSYSPGVMKTAQTIQETMIDPLQRY